MQRPTAQAIAGMAWHSHKWQPEADTPGHCTFQCSCCEPSARQAESQGDFVGIVVGGVCAIATTGLANLEIMCRGRAGVMALCLTVLCQIPFSAAALSSSPSFAKLVLSLSFAFVLHRPCHFECSHMIVTPSVLSCSCVPLKAVSLFRPAKETLSTLWRT